MLSGAEHETPVVSVSPDYVTCPEQANPERREVGRRGGGVGRAERHESGCSLPTVKVSF